MDTIIFGLEDELTQNVSDSSAPHTQMKCIL